MEKSLGSLKNVNKQKEKGKDRSEEDYQEEQENRV
jgi:hypothetical protein